MKKGQARRGYTKRFLVASYFVETEIDFFLYDFSGNLVKKFSWKQDREFELPLLYKKAKKRVRGYKAGDTFAGIDLIDGYKDGFCVFLQQIDVIKADHRESHVFCLIFSEDGKL